MDRIMVQKKEGKKISDEAEWLNADDIVKCGRELFNKKEYKIVIYTDSGEYVHCSSNLAFLKLMSEREGMMLTDTGTLGNLYKMKSVDYEDGKVYFDDEESEYITIARSKTKLVKEYIKKLFGK
ncbi:hypothetical protein [Paenibacillus xylanexedens]|uniref:hypothetical protein n=1 Tax=Paenibacillus xylanexedens TaxID=528191 RepID=UPI0011AA4DD3|nr:hypothetical protein [Paenibacillus xylanexedens]